LEFSSRILLPSNIPATKMLQKLVEPSTIPVSTDMKDKITTLPNLAVVTSVDSRNLEEPELERCPPSHLGPLID
jgi:hypothetical protein